MFTSQILSCVLARAAPIAVSAAVLLAAETTAAAEPFTAEQEARIRELAIEALLEKPEVLRQVISRLEAREAAAAGERRSDALAQLREELTDDANAPVVGNPDGDVTVVEFMDYNCGYCKRAAPEVEKLLEADAGVRLVYREWPILGEGSVAAARLALAAREQNAYARMHEALMARSRVSEQTALDVARELGLDVEKLVADAKSEAVDAHIRQSMALAKAIEITGTPAFVIGDVFIGGLAPVESLLETVTAEREARGG